MKTTELKDKSIAELNEALRETLQERFILRMKSATDQITQHHKLKVARRQIARLKTLIHQKQQAKGAAE